jgi:DNA-directed RNA polymerase subunit RPC12/RpoP
MKVIKILLLLTGIISIAVLASAAVLPYFIQTANFQRTIEPLAGLLVYLICAPTAFILAFLYRRYLESRAIIWLIIGCLFFPFVFPFIIATRRTAGSSSGPAVGGPQCVRCGKRLKHPPAQWVGTGAALAEMGLTMPYNCPSCGLAYCLDCMALLRETSGVCPQCGASVK